MDRTLDETLRTIDAKKKYVVSSTLDRVDWNAELVRGDLGKAVQQLKQESGKGLFTGGVKLPMALAELGLIDEYEFVVHPRLAGHGPALFAGLSKRIDLKLVSRLEFGSGAVALRYEPRRSAFNGKHRFSSDDPTWRRASTVSSLERTGASTRWKPQTNSQKGRPWGTGSHSSRSSTETSPATLRRSKLTRVE
jgi:dihydrofolate reductase